MAINFMDLLGSVVQGGLTPSAGSRMSNAGNGLQDLLGSLMGGGQSIFSRAGQAMGGSGNLAATGLGALLGALTGNSSSTTINSVGGGLMGLLGMMAYKALSNSGSSNSISYKQPSHQQQESDAEIILTAMIDAAKSDGQVDSQELSRIMSNLKSNGVGQENVNFIISKLQAPMETNKILNAVRNRPDLAAQVYSASLMAIEVDTRAERNYLDNLAHSMGLSQDVVNNIEQLTGIQN